MISIANIKLHEKLTQITSKPPKILAEKTKVEVFQSSHSSKFHLKQIMHQNNKIHDKIQHM